jgi:branched-chain amino acid transport system ATP-binding protein
MLDEPSLGLSPVLTKELFRSLKSIAATGVGILLVEQNARQSLKIADRGYLIEVGCITGEGTAQSLMSDPAVVSAYLGGGGAARPTAQSIRLPAPFVLPGDLAAIGRLIGTLAVRAGAIQTAFVRSLRRVAKLPSAFIGRYDPKIAPDPWDELAASASSGVSPSRASAVGDARKLTDHAAELAKAATLRHARHIRSLRAARENPSAFVGLYDPATALNDIDPLDPGALAKSAGDRLVDHIRSRRAALPVPSAFVRHADPALPDTPTIHPALHPALGHNSRGVDIDAERQRDAEQPRNEIDVAALVTRASTIHAAHVASRRKTLTITTLKPDEVLRRDKSG